MARTTSESKAVRDNLTGHNVAATVPIPELISITSGDVRGRFASLENDEQRQGFLDSITTKLDSNWGNWAKFYEAVSIIREQKSYWQSKGFDSFESFWRAKAGPAFQSFKELEGIYNFAKTACPELFGIDFEGAKQLRKKLEKLSSIPALAQNGVTKAKKRLYSDTTEAHAAVTQAMGWHNAGGTSLEYRLAKLKRDRPDIAARILAGEFFKELGTGQIGIDMAAAEREAYGEVTRKPKRQASNVGSEVAKTIRSAAKSQTSRQQVINELREIPWLMEALAANFKKKR
ncbi:MAG: hypothetical protein Q8J80_03255 [Gallionella sp.]|nr:hypothetical protein [Gallionella sp.]